MLQQLETPTRADDLSAYASAANDLFNDDEPATDTANPMSGVQLADGTSAQSKAVIKGLEKDGYLDVSKKESSTLDSPTYRTGKSDRQIWEEEHAKQIREDNIQRTKENLRKFNPSWTEKQLYEAARRKYLP